MQPSALLFTMCLIRCVAVRINPTVFVDATEPGCDSRVSANCDLHVPF